MQTCGVNLESDNLQCESCVQIYIFFWPANVFNLRKQTENAGYVLQETPTEDIFLTHVCRATAALTMYL